MEELIKEYGAIVIAGLATIIILTGFIMALKGGVGDIVISYVNGIL